MNEEIDIILSRYFSGEATEKELHNLDVWLAKSDENEEYFYQMTLLYQHTGQKGDLPAIDTEKALQQFKSYMNKKQQNSFKLSFKVSTLWRVAAAIALIVVAVFASYYFTEPSKTVQLTAVETQKEYTLFENAEVTLFPGTEIVYNKKTAHKIQLTGKADFNIQSERSKKLVVQAGETYIEDIGTVFSIDATHPNKSITVTVAEGEVWFYTAHNTGIYLKANESAIYDALTKQFIKLIEKQSMIDDKMLAEEVPAEESTAQELAFHNISLQEAIEIIKAHYHVDIIVKSNELNNILLNVSFSNNESVEYVLEIISETLSAQVTKNGNRYIIML